MKANPHFRVALAYIGDEQLSWSRQAFKKSKHYYVMPSILYLAAELEALAWKSGDIPDGSAIEVQSICVPNDAAPEGMIRLSFHRRRQPQHLIPPYPLQGDDIAYGWLSAGECAGLIECYGSKRP